MWHFRPMMREFSRRCCSIAVPQFVSTIDEASASTNRSALAKSYIPSKPDKFAIRFYSVVESKTCTFTIFGTMDKVILVKITNL